MAAAAGFTRQPEAIQCHNTVKAEAGSAKVAQCTPSTRPPHARSRSVRLAFTLPGFAERSTGCGVPGHQRTQVPSTARRILASKAADSRTASASLVKSRTRASRSAHASIARQRRAEAARPSAHRPHEAHGRAGMNGAAPLDPKTRSTLIARAALLGVALHVTDDDAGRALFIASKWQLTRQMSSVAEVESSCGRSVGPAHEAQTGLCRALRSSRT